MENDKLFPVGPSNNLITSHSAERLTRIGYVLDKVNGTPILPEIDDVIRWLRKDYGILVLIQLQHQMGFGKDSTYTVYHWIVYDLNKHDTIAASHHDKDFSGYELYEYAQCLGIEEAYKYISDNDLELNMNPISTENYQIAGHIVFNTYKPENDISPEDYPFISGSPAIGQ